MVEHTNLAWFRFLQDSAPESDLFMFASIAPDPAVNACVDLPYMFC